MARLKLSIPDSKIVFSTDIILTVNFINYGGHMGNDAILTLCQEARIRYFKTLGMSEINFFDHSLIQSDAMVIYKSEAYLQDVLKVDMWIDDVNDYGMDFVYRFTNESNGKEVARAKTGIVFYNYEIKKIAKAPQSFFDYIKS